MENVAIGKREVGQVGQLARGGRIAAGADEAGAVRLAGDEGARVRVSIAAKARSIRTRGLADAEGAAQAASERMSLPVVLLMTGFIAVSYTHLTLPTIYSV